eukprot:CAMPEP_0119551102 /NCGR_PEP_ID=MMETSP1352-20130426/4460_1 /TAXON_ID=265584 /ORGANISM="Stauroneis constricta, Strain CCMP1120" /LENGTH=471 /DNA_ID=CAMNT_0007597111 /DNA_START=87 /DNA_END=1502 /DNA_ORIENTATION=+
MCQNSDETKQRSPQTNAATVDGALERLRTTKLPFIVELVVAWVVILLFSIRYMIGYLLLVIQLKRLRAHPDQWYRHVPITSVARTTSSLSKMPRDMMDRLIHILSESKKGAAINDADIIRTLQSNLEARQLASQIMLAADSCSFDTSTMTKSTTAISSNELKQQLQRLWPILLHLSPATLRKHANDRSYQHRISVIIPAYKETPQDIHETLSKAHDRCSDASTIQIIVVQAGGGHSSPGDDDDDDDHLNQLQAMNNSWGDLHVLHHRGGGGRGRSMNVGAEKATGEILTFLHADTILPQNWDLSIRKALLGNGSSNGSIDKRPNNGMATCCAFTQGIDISPVGLKGGPCPAGINPACEILGFLRCRICKLPYGDSVLSFPADLFHYMGGYPDQPLMEDFEIVSQLRKRSYLLDERIVILKDRAYCSVRRWQAFGVIYTVLVNALCVHRYTSGTTADELFDFYYRKSTKKME